MHFEVSVEVNLRKVSAKWGMVVHNGDEGVVVVTIRVCSLLGAVIQLVGVGEFLAKGQPVEDDLFLKTVMTKCTCVVAGKVRGLLIFVIHQRCSLTSQ